MDHAVANDLRTRLAHAFGGRLRHVLVYGSEARGRAGPESDIDLMVVLDDPVDVGRDISAIMRAIYPVQLELERPIHVLPVGADAFAAAEYALYRRAKQEGIPI